LGAYAFTSASNLYDDLFFSPTTPTLMLLTAFSFTSKPFSHHLLALVVLPSVLRSSHQAYTILYYTGQCGTPWCATLVASCLPWVAGALVTHLQVYSYLVNWTALAAGMCVQWVSPMFMWAQAAKEANRYEANYRESMQMII
jgi:hypothetical protein